MSGALCEDAPYALSFVNNGVIDHKKIFWDDLDGFFFVKGETSSNQLG